MSGQEVSRLPDARCYRARIFKKEKSLLYTHPKLAAEWHPAKNGEITPLDITKGSHKKVWWLGKCGHEWDATVKERVRGYGCPICAGKRVVEGVNDLASVNPALALEWDYLKNSPLTPNMVASKSHKKVYWLCNQNYSYQSSVDNRGRGRGCPYCNSRMIMKGKNDLESQNSFLASEYSSRNVQPANEVFVHSHAKVFWQCSICGHEWVATVDSRSRGSGCPKCAQRTQTSFPEQSIYYYIKLIHTDAINRYVGLDENRMELDIFVPSLKIGIEYDGRYWHQGRQSVIKEKQKYEKCKQKGITLIRIREQDIIDTDNCDYSINVADNLSNAIHELSRYLPMPESIDVNRDRQAIMENYIGVLRDKSFAEMFPDIAREWDFKKNGELTPHMFSSYSTLAKFWWRCEKGHTWKSTIAHRTSMNSGCPYCANRKLLRGYNDFLTTNEDVTLFMEWNIEKNEQELIHMDSIMEGSKKKVWWKCKNGHEWQNTVGGRKRGEGCPFCSGRRVLVGFNDLATMHPKIAAEWNYNKNRELTPTMVTKSSNKKYGGSAKMVMNGIQVLIVAQTDTKDALIVPGNMQ